MITNTSQPAAQPILARSCASFFCRLRGLAFRRDISPSQSLLLESKNDNRLDAAIHMLGMFSDLAIAWINGRGEVVDVRLARRWRSFILPLRPARYVLEMAPEMLALFAIGDSVHFEEVWLD
ncbi:MAG: DUF192 domain-containing protein [Chloroflexi bacterium]|nr:DUF192 domain-containing protein [Chloroflexota bacterium]